MGVAKILFPRQIVDENPNDGESWWYYSTVSIVPNQLIADEGLMYELRLPSSSNG